MAAGCWSEAGRANSTAVGLTLKYKTRRTRNSQHLVYRHTLRDKIEIPATKWVYIIDKSEYMMTCCLDSDDLAS